MSSNNLSAKLLWMTCLFLFCLAPSILAQSFLEEVNQVTVTDIEDLQDLHFEYSIPRGDVDANGQVEFADFLVLSSNYGRSGMAYEDGDITLDGVVGFADFAIHTNTFGTQEFEFDPPSRSPADITLSLDESRQVILTASSPVSLVGMELFSASESLTPVPDPPGSNPFTFFLSNTPSRITWGNLGSSVQVGDRFSQTGVFSSSDDVVLTWAEVGAFDVFSQTIDGSPLPPNPQVKENVLAAATTIDELMALHEENNLARGDLDGSGRVTGNDFATLSNNYGKAVTQYSDGDVNLDGIVDIKDLAVLSHNFGNTDFTPDPPATSPVQFSLSSTDTGLVVISTDEPVNLNGVEFTSESDAFKLNQFTSETRAIGLPFDRVVAISSDRIALATLGNSVSVDGDLTTNLGLRPGDHNITAKWFQSESYETFSTVPTQLTRDVTALLLADVDSDGTIGFSDFLILSNNYTSNVSPFSDGDIDGDGEVQFPDFVFLAFHFGESTSATLTAASVPEPTTRWLLMFAGVALIAIRRRSAISNRAI